MNDISTFVKTTNQNLESKLRVLFFCLVIFSFTHSYQLSHTERYSCAFEVARLTSQAMFKYNKLENPFNKPTANNNDSSRYLDAAFQLLDSLNDKDEQVKAIAEASLLKIADKKPDEVILFVCDYKKKNPKLIDPVIAVILR